MAKEILYDKEQNKSFREKLNRMFTEIYTSIINIPTKLSQLTNDRNFISDENYVHTDNNYTTAEKNKLAGLTGGTGEVKLDTDFINVLPVNNTYTLNLNLGRNFKIQITNTETKNISFSNVPSGENKLIHILVLCVYTSAASINHPISVTWGNGEPELVEGKTYLLDYTSMNNGVSWTGLWVENWI